MITMSVTGFVLGSSHELFNSIVSAVTDILPSGKEELSQNLNNIVSGRSRLGGVGVVFLLFIASLLFSSVEHALDRIFQSVKKRNFFHSRLISVLLVFGVTFFLFTPTVVDLFQTGLEQFNINVPLGDLATNRMFFAGMLVVAFVLVVKVIPNHNVQIRYAVVGGIFFALGMAAAKFIFRWYVAQAFDRYNVIYGSLTVLVVTVVWIYYIANILLLSSEIAAVLQRRYGPCPTNGTNGDRA